MSALRNSQTPKKNTFDFQDINSSTISETGDSFLLPRTPFPVKTKDNFGNNVSPFLNSKDFRPFKVIENISNKENYHSSAMKKTTETNIFKTSSSVIKNSMRDILLSKENDEKEDDDNKNNATPKNRARPSEREPNAITSRVNVPPNNDSKFLATSSRINTPLRHKDDNDEENDDDVVETMKTTPNGRLLIDYAKLSHGNGDNDDGDMINNQEGTPMSFAGKTKTRVPSSAVVDLHQDTVYVGGADFNFTEDDCSNLSALENDGSHVDHVDDDLSSFDLHPSSHVGDEHYDDNNNVNEQSHDRYQYHNENENDNNNYNYNDHVHDSSTGYDGSGLLDHSLHQVDSHAVDENYRLGDIVHQAHSLNPHDDDHLHLPTDIKLHDISIIPYTGDRRNFSSTTQYSPRPNSSTTEISPSRHANHSPQEKSRPSFSAPGSRHHSPTSSSPRKYRQNSSSQAKSYLRDDNYGSPHQGSTPRNHLRRFDNEYDSSSSSGISRRGLNQEERRFEKSPKHSNPMSGETEELEFVTEFLKLDQSQKGRLNISVEEYLAFKKKNHHNEPAALTSMSNGESRYVYDITTDGEDVIEKKKMENCFENLHYKSEQDPGRYDHMQKDSSDYPHHDDHNHYHHDDNKLYELSSKEENEEVYRYGHDKHNDILEQDESRHQENEKNYYSRNAYGNSEPENEIENDGENQFGDHAFAYGHSYEANDERRYEQVHQGQKYDESNNNRDYWRENDGHQEHYSSNNHNNSSFDNNNNDNNDSANYNYNDNVNSNYSDNDNYSGEENNNYDDNNYNRTLHIHNDDIDNKNNNNDDDDDDNYDNNANHNRNDGEDIYSYASDFNDYVDNDDVNNDKDLYNKNEINIKENDHDVLEKKGRSVRADYAFDASIYDSEIANDSDNDKTTSSGVYDNFNSSWYGRKRKNRQSEKSQKATTQSFQESHENQDKVMPSSPAVSLSKENLRQFNNGNLPTIEKNLDNSASGFSEEQSLRGGQNHEFLVPQRIRAKNISTPAKTSGTVTQATTEFSEAASRSKGEHHERKAMSGYGTVKYSDTPRPSKLSSNKIIEGSNFTNATAPVRTMMCTANSSPATSSTPIPDGDMEHGNGTGLSNSKEKKRDTFINIDTPRPFKSTDSRRRSPGHTISRQTGMGGEKKSVSGVTVKAATGTPTAYSQKSNHSSAISKGNGPLNKDTPRPPKSRNKLKNGHPIARSSAGNSKPNMMNSTSNNDACRESPKISDSSGKISSYIHQATPMPPKVKSNRGSKGSSTSQDSPKISNLNGKNEPYTHQATAIAPKGKANVESSRDLISDEPYVHEATPMPPKVNSNLGYKGESKSQNPLKISDVSRKSEPYIHQATPMPPKDKANLEGARESIAKNGTKLSYSSKTSEPDVREATPMPPSKVESNLGRKGESNSQNDPKISDSSEKGDSYVHHATPMPPKVKSNIGRKGESNSQNSPKNTDVRNTSNSQIHQATPTSSKVSNFRNKDESSSRKILELGQQSESYTHQDTPMPPKVESNLGSKGKSIASVLTAQGPSLQDQRTQQQKSQAEILSSLTTENEKQIPYQHTDTPMPKALSKSPNDTAQPQRPRPRPQPKTLTSIENSEQNPYRHTDTPKAKPRPLEHQKQKPETDTPEPEAQPTFNSSTNSTQKSKLQTNNAPPHQLKQPLETLPLENERQIPNPHADTPIPKARPLNSTLAFKRPAPHRRSLENATTPLRNPTVQEKKNNEDDDTYMGAQESPSSAGTPLILTSRSSGGDMQTPSAPIVLKELTESVEKCKADINATLQNVEIGYKSPTFKTNATSTFRNQDDDLTDLGKSSPLSFSPGKNITLPVETLGQQQQLKDIGNDDETLKRDSKNEERNADIHLTNPDYSKMIDDEFRSGVEGSHSDPKNDQDFVDKHNLSKNRTKIRKRSHQPGSSIYNDLEKIKEKLKAKKELTGTERDARSTNTTMIVNAPPSFGDSLLNFVKNLLIILLMVILFCQVFSVSQFILFFFPKNPRPT